MVYAAASLTNALTEVEARYEQESGKRVTTSFASSSMLAKQIERGAPADVFLSADKKWMDYLANKKKIDTGTRRDLLGNSLVLIAPEGRRVDFKMEAGFQFAESFKGRLCTGDPGHVPVGIYAKQALQHLGWWEAIARRIVPTEDVRAALTFVERGECPLGIVYSTDARVSDKVQTIGAFPADSHDPIVYPVALVEGRGEGGADFLRFLSSKTAEEIFRKYGFTVLRAIAGHRPR
jgi:molybdate transport system substrate-binding protein